MYLKIDNINIQYANAFILNMGLGYPTTCVHQFSYDKHDSNDTNIIQYFNMYGLGLCIKLDSFVAHMFNVWYFSFNAAVPIAIKNNECFLSLNKYTTVFVWGDCNLNNNISEILD